MLQSDLSVKMKGQTKRGWQIHKGTCTGRDNHNTFTNFTGTYEVAQ